MVTSVAVDRIATWRTDHELALSHGFASVLSENGGPGGLSHTLRSVPLMLEIGRDVERLAPNAVLFNYTNPENRVCLALHRHTSTRIVGLCHSLAEAIDACATVLGRPRDTIEVIAAGANHFTWFVSVRDVTDGSDLMPEFRRRTLAGDPRQAPVRNRLIEQLGSHPAIDDDHVGEYLPWAAALIGTSGYDFERHDRRSLADIDMLEAWGSGARPSMRSSPSRRRRPGSTTARPRSWATWSPAGPGAARRSSCPTTGTSTTCRPTRWSRCRASSRTASRAACRSGRCRSPSPRSSATSSRSRMPRSRRPWRGRGTSRCARCLLDPVVTDVHAAERFLDAILDAHRAHLPRFWS